MDNVLADLRCLDNLISSLRRNDPMGFYELETEDKIVQVNGRDVVCKFLTRVTVIPSMAIAFWKANPFKIASADATHLSNVFGGVLNTIGAMDGDKKRLTLFLCVCPCENKENWTNSLQNARDYLFANDIHMLISDRDKGLLAADEILPNCVHTFCSVHIARNVGLGSNTGYHDIAAVAKAPTMRAYEGALAGLLEKFEKSKAGLGEKLRDVANEFCTAQLLLNQGNDENLPFVTNYGVTSNNISEQENGALNEIRHLPYTRLVLQFMSRMESITNDRRRTLDSLVGKVAVLPSAMNVVAAQAKEVRESHFFVRYRSSSESATVFCSWDVVRLDAKGATEINHTVQLFPLAEKWQDRIQCACNYFLAKGIPCKHASAVLAYCAASINVAKSFLRTHIKNDKVRELFNGMNDPRWYAPGFHLEVNRQMYAAVPPLLPPYEDLGSDELLFPFTSVSKLPGSTKQRQAHDEVMRRREYLRTLTEDVDERSLPDEMWHQYLLFTYLNQQFPEKRIQCSTCNMYGHRAPKCKQAAAAQVLLVSPGIQRRLANTTK